ncbi:MAG: carbon starvation protein A, partial [Acidobacteriota bacterium]|nr:carbon starvation protein A [Acidobacteriota bacterium]
MEAIWAAAGCLVTYFIFYRFYARYLGRWVFRLDPDRPTPAHQLRDNVDYVPCRRSVLFGHHYASIAGLS